jgi:hypothetical protein
MRLHKRGNSTFMLLIIRSYGRSGERSAQQSLRLYADIRKTLPSEGTDREEEAS